MGIGLKLKDLIDAKGTNVNEVAVATGVSPQTIYSIIKRDSEKAAIEDLGKIANYLGVDLNYFYSGAHITKPAAESDGFDELSPMQRELFVMLKKLTPEQLEAVVAVIKQMLRERE